MTSPAIPHPPDFVALCERAVAELEALPRDRPEARAARVATLRALLQEVGVRMAELDIRDPAFPDEQATLADAASALLAIDLDRGGPHVPRYAGRIAADLRRLATG
jgi:hypothetical protein